MRGHLFCRSSKVAHLGACMRRELANLRDAIDLYVQDLIEAVEQIPVVRARFSNYRNQPVVCPMLTSTTRAIQLGDSFALWKPMGYSATYPRKPPISIAWLDGRRVVVAFSRVGLTRFLYGHSYAASPLLVRRKVSGEV